jgi:adenylate cyclase
MANIFVSYSHEDRERIRPLVEILKAEGWSVWWDREIHAGPRFDKVIEKEVDNASCVIVAWSETSVHSDWVRDEANEGREREILVPALFHQVRPPMGFRAAQTADMINWPDERGDIDALLSGVRAILGRPVTGVKAQTSVAVLPFTNMSNDADQDFFCDGMSESLINMLAQIGALRVISRTTAMYYKNSTEPLPKIARALSVESIVEGSVTLTSDKVRISVQLIHVPTDRPLWADSYVRDREDIFALQSEVARTIAHQIRVTITPEEEAKLERTEESMKPEAHKAYLKGLYCRNLITPEGLNEALEHALEAASLDPRAARAYTLLAEIYVLQGMYGFNRPREVYPLAKRNATKALKIDETLAAAHSIWAWSVQVMDHDIEISARGYEAALKLNPGHTNTLMRYGAFKMGVGEPLEGIALLKKSVDVDPLSLIINAIYAYGLFLKRDYEDAIAHCKSVLEWEPDYWWIHWNLGETFSAQGRHADAVSAHEKAFALSRNAFTIGGLGRSYALSGQHEKARGLLDKLLEHATQAYISPYFIGYIYIGLGERDEAVKYLMEAWHQRDSWVQFINVNPSLDIVRDHPGFDDILIEMGFKS